MTQNKDTKNTITVDLPTKVVVVIAIKVVSAVFCFCSWAGLRHLDADAQSLEDVNGGAGLVLGKGQLEVLEAVAARRPGTRAELPREQKP